MTRFPKQLRRLLLTAGLLTTLTVHAQHIKQDYLVTNAGDTLRGTIQLLGKASQTLRLHRPGEASVLFTASQASSYGSGNTSLKVSKKVGVHGSPRFVVPLVRGYVSLYAGKNDDAQVRYYLQPTDSAYVIEVLPTLALLTYARLLPGCPSLEIGTDKFQARYRYDSNGLVRLVTDYNICRQQPTELVKAPSGLRVSIGAKAGFNYTNFNLATDSYSEQVYATNHTQATGYQAGLLLLLTTRSGFGVQLEGNYVRLSSNYGPVPPSAYNSGIYLGTYALRVRYSQLQFPVLLRYTFGHSAIAPYVNAGPAIGIRISDASSKSAYNISGTATTEEPFPVAVNSLSLGGVAGAGLSLRKPAWPALFLEGRYSYMVYNYDSQLHHNALHLDLGLYF